MPFSGPKLEAVLLAHHLSNQTPAGLRGGWTEPDWSRQPPVTKTYPGLPEIPLGRLEPSGHPSLADVVAFLCGNGRIAAAPHSAETFARLTNFSYGVRRTLQGRSGATYTKRVVASAGALFPCEVYWLLPPAGDPRPGLYYHDPARHTFVLLRKGDLRSALAEALPPEAVSAAGRRGAAIVTAIPWRNAWKYGLRAHRYVPQDSGHLMASVALAAAACGWKPLCVLDDAETILDQLLGIDGIHETIQGVVLLGDGPLAPADAMPQHLPAASPGDPIPGWDALPDALPPAIAGLRIDSANDLLDYRTKASVPFVSTFQRDFPWIHDPIPLPPPPPALGGFDTLTTARRSLRDHDLRDISPEDLSALLAAASEGMPAVAPGEDHPICALRDVEIAVAVHAVAGIPPGVYGYDRNAHRLRPLVRGEIRARTQYIANDQDHGGSCAALIIFLADLDALIRTKGPRGYRRAYVASGWAAHLLALAAEDRGLGACCIGSFLDDDVPRLLGNPHGPWAGTLLVTVGPPPG